MIKIVKYHSDDGRVYNTEEDALKADADFRQRQKSWQDNTATSKLDKLKFNLEKACVIHPETIATCSFDALAIKGMVIVCKEFVEANKDYLNYY